MPRSMPTSWITVNWPSCFCKRREMNSYAAHSVNCWQRSWGGVALWFVLSSLAISARRSIQANLCTEVSKLKMSFLCKRSIENDKISHLQRIGCDTTKKTFYPYMDHRLKQSLLDFRFECSLAQRRVCWSMVVQFTFFCQSFLLWANSPTLSVTFSLLHHLCLPSLFSPSFCISLLHLCLWQENSSNSSNSKHIILIQSPSICSSSFYICAHPALLSLYPSFAVSPFSLSSCGVS